ncbi:MAG: deoxyribose-phosphate aldolase [Bacteroidales bacterium]|jgi:deoxyribose-phosphate aldolase|nr:deoxyribose-phosphate aldolase [Bacteroidales bacterium]
MQTLEQILATPLPYPQAELNKKIMSFIDLTTLEGADTKEKVIALCNKAKQHQTAAICVYPPFAKIVHEQLIGTNIQTACVAGAFPAGQSPIHIKTAEVAYTVEQGAQEIDMVISRGIFLEGDYATVGTEIKAIRDVCGGAHLKVILETGELQTPENIKLASEIAIANINNGDFIKTSTGKVAVNATPEAAFVMLNAIKTEYEKTGKKIGFKPAGGVSTPADAEIYVKLVYRILGEEWLTPKLFRIGASRLVDALVGTHSTQSY